MTAALDGLRVIDASTLFAGPMAAMFLGDFGSDVVKVEHPTRPDPARGHGPSKNDVGLWWKVLGRNKQAMTCDLSQQPGQEVMRRLVAGADVLIENFRPGTLERWNLSYEELASVNPRLVLARVTGFGQFGPYARRPGFGTLAEAMSGFAAMTGEPDGPPTLPPFGLADGIAALATAFTIMTALQARESSGRGQVIDLAIIEPIVTLLGPGPIVYDQLGTVQPRTGNRSAHNAPRNVYRTADDRWVAVSTSATSVAERVIRLVGRADLAEQPWFATGAGRVAHAGVLDAAVSSWVGSRSMTEVLGAFADADGAAAPVYDVAGMTADPHFLAREVVTSVPDEELGSVAMQNVLARLSSSPGEIKWAGPPHGAHTDEVLADLGYSASEIDRLRASGAV